MFGFKKNRKIDINQKLIDNLENLKSTNEVNGRTVNDITNLINEQNKRAFEMISSLNNLTQIR